jgi:hypothetical protein
MAQVSVGAAIEAGFRLIGRRPLTVLAWGLTQGLMLVAVVLALGPLYVAMFEAARSGQGPTAFQNLSPQILQTEGLAYLVDLFEVVIYSIIYCAVWRAVLRPQDSRFAYLRLGMPEFFVGILLIGAYFALFFGSFIAAIPVAIVIVGLVASKAVAAAVIFGLVAFLVLIVAIVYLLLRFSLVGPLMVDDGKFHLGESWRMTRGHVGSLFLIGLTLFVVALAIDLIFGIVLVAVGAGALAALAGGLQNLPIYMQQPNLISRLGPVFILLGVLWVPFAGVVCALMAAPWASAYLDLKPKDVSAAFA